MGRRHAGEAPGRGAQKAALIGLQGGRKRAPVSDTGVTGTGRSAARWNPQLVGEWSTEMHSERRTGGGGGGTQAKEAAGADREVRLRRMAERSLHAVDDWLGSRWVEKDQGGLTRRVSFVWAG
jgi:hypothetical protein